MVMRELYVLSRGEVGYVGGSSGTKLHSLVTLEIESSDIQSRRRG